MTALLFPGQGSQRAGMGADLFDRFPEMVAEADAVLGYSIREVCIENPDAKLDRTEITQPAIYVVAALRYRTLEAGTPPQMMAGHSLGEYVALYAAGAFSFADGLRMVQERGRLMGEIAGGGLVALIGYDASQIERLLTEDRLDGVEIANINSPEQIVVGGRKGDLQRLLEACRSRGIRAVPLRVSGAFHTSQMSPAAERYASFLSEMDFAAPKVEVLSNVTGKPHVASDMRARLIEQIDSPVQWSRSIETMLEAGVTDFSELGSPPVLMPMVNVVRRHWEGVAAPASLPEAKRGPGSDEAAELPSPSVPETWPRPQVTNSELGEASVREALARRPDLDDETRQALLKGEGALKDVPDWHFPELGTSSLSFVRHPVLAAAARALQACYGSRSVSAERIAEIGSRLPLPFCDRLHDLAADMEASCDPRTRRALIRERANDIFSPGIVPCGEPGSAPSNKTAPQIMEKQDG